MQENTIYEAICTNPDCSVLTFMWTTLLRTCPSCTWMGAPDRLLHDVPLGPRR